MLGGAESCINAEILASTAEITEPARGAKRGSAGVGDRKKTQKSLRRKQAFWGYRRISPVFIQASSSSAAVSKVKTRSLLCV